MSILDRIADLGSAVKDRVGAALGDGPDHHADDDVVDSGAAVRVAPAMTEPEARQVLGLTDTCTLDDVRAAADDRARGAHAAAITGRPGGQEALDRIATAAELLEEVMLPLGSVARGGAVSEGDDGAGGSSSGRTRATARR